MYKVLKESTINRNFQNVTLVRVLSLSHILALLWKHHHSDLHLKKNRKKLYFQISPLTKKWYKLLTHCILVDSSTVIGWMSPFVILGVSGQFCLFFLFLIENPISKYCRPWSDATLCGIWSGSALFAYDPFKGFPVRMGSDMILIMFCNARLLCLPHNISYIVTYIWMGSGEGPQYRFLWKLYMKESPSDLQYFTTTQSWLGSCSVVVDQLLENSREHSMTWYGYQVGHLWPPLSIHIIGFMNNNQ